MVGETVEQRRGHLGVTDGIGPFAEGENGGDDDRGALVGAADQVEQQLSTRLSEGQVAESVGTGGRMFRNTHMGVTSMLNCDWPQ